MKKAKSEARSDNNGPQKSPAKRSTCPGLRVVGSRIYDSDNGKTCHQCRQKTMDFAAACKNLKKDKPCTIKICHKCLLNRYGEKAEKVALVDDWICPKCRGICNCSFCMKKRGHKPTGMLVHTAKAIGFSSVSEMLCVKGPENVIHDKIVKDMGASPRKLTSLNKENAVSPRKRGKENSFDGNSDLKLQPQNLASNLDEKKPKKMKREGLNETHNGHNNDVALLENTNPRKPRASNETSKKMVKTNPKDTELNKKHSCMQTSKEVSLDHKEKKKQNNGTVGLPHKDVGARVSNCEKTDDARAKPKTVLESCGVEKLDVNLQKNDFGSDVPLPQGTDLVSVSGIELHPENVGHALQFLEFCSVFGKVLNLRKGLAESVLRELVNGSCGRPAQYSAGVKFHIQLLSLILEDMGEKSPSLSCRSGKNTWLQALGKCVSEMQCLPKELPPDCFDGGTDGYDKLDFSKKLRLLNFLCDEALSTETFRYWIDDQNLKLTEKEKKAKDKVAAARDKEKRMKQKLQDEVAKAIIAKNGAPLTISEHEAVVSQIKLEAAQAHAEMLEAVDMLPKMRQRSAATRTEPILLDVDGRVYWRLKGYSGESDILLQELGTCDTVTPEDKWLAFDAEQKTEIEKYICLRARRVRFQKVSVQF